MDDRIEQLEFRIAYLEQANAQLGDLVYEQRKEIDALHEQLARLIDRLASVQEQPAVQTPEKERPPHY